MGSLLGGMNASNLPLVGGLFGDPTKANMQQQFQQTGQAYQGYRPELAQAQMNALSNRMSAFQGANNIIARLYGGGNAVNPSQMLRNPMTPGMMAQGAPASMMGGQRPQGGGGLLSGILGGGGGSGGILGGIL